MIFRKTGGKRPGGSVLGLAVLAALGLALAGVYAALAALSFQFAPEIPAGQQPILAAIALLACAYALHLMAVFAALRVRQDHRLLGAIVLGSVVFRAVSLFSWPILEIDIYRYIWDGNVTLAGVSPYRYSPAQVRSASPQAGIAEPLRLLVRLRESDERLATILSRVHYGELPTIYPPVSQAVFAAVAYATPRGAGIFGRVVAMKAAFVLFDLGTLAVVVALLRMARKPIGWSIAYGWCPLVIKEFANTGHLDSWAVFLTVAAMFFALKPLDGRGRGSGVPGWRAARGTAAVVSSVLLALGVGAKLYPVVLAPVLLAVWVRSAGWRWALAASLAGAATAGAALWPMLPPPETPSSKNQGTVVADEDGFAVAERSAAAGMAPQDPSGGLKAFLRHWEMNDFLFMLAVENLKPWADAANGPQPWFSIVPEAWRSGVLRAACRWLQTGQMEAAFLVARLLALAATAAIVAGVVWRARRAADPAAWLRAAFLSLAWFWLLSPTQNPWYWTWALPLVMFAHNGAWLAGSGLVMVYYLRFWFAYRWPEGGVLGTGYSGRIFFDYVVTWMEYAPWLFCLAWGWIRSRKPAAESTEIADEVAAGSTD